MAMGLTWKPGGRGSEDFYETIAVQSRNVSLTGFTADSESVFGLGCRCNRRKSRG